MATSRKAVTAFVQIRTEAGKAIEVAKGLERHWKQGVTEVYVTTGDFDVLAVVQVETVKDLVDLVEGIAAPHSPQLVTGTNTIVAYCIHD